MTQANDFWGVFATHVIRKGMKRGVIVLTRANKGKTLGRKSDLFPKSQSLGESLETDDYGCEDAKRWKTDRGGRKRENGKIHEADEVKRRREDQKGARSFEDVSIGRKSGWNASRDFKSVRVRVNLGSSWNAELGKRRKFKIKHHLNPVPNLEITTELKAET